MENNVLTVLFVYEGILKCPYIDIMELCACGVLGNGFVCLLIVETERTYKQPKTIFRYKTSVSYENKLINFYTQDKISLMHNYMDMR